MTNKSVKRFIGSHTKQGTFARHESYATRLTLQKSLAFLPTHTETGFMRN